MSVDSQPSVSVVIPAFNNADMIGHALDSVVRQSYRPAEIIVVDDGSTDDTSMVVGRYGSLVRLVRQENSGAAVARNRGIDESTGRYIAFLDADDS